MTEQISELDRMKAEHTYLDAFLAGEWIDIPFDTLGDLMETAAFDFSLDHEGKKLNHVETIRLSPSWSTPSLVDSIMLFAYPLEPIDVSISRLATAARYLGFSDLTPYAAAICYFRFRKLKEKYNPCQKKTHTKITSSDPST